MAAPPLRPYQEEQIAQIRAKFMQGKRRLILCAPTGSGKTRTFTEIVYQTLSKGLFSRVMVVTDRIELFKQTMKAINLRGIETYTFDADARPKEQIQERCIIGMIETIKRRAERGPEALHRAIGDVTLIIIDEAHKGNFKAVFDIWPNAFVIGATATPVSQKKDEPLSLWYNDIVNVVNIPQLVQEGYLAEAHHYMMLDADTSGLKVSKGEYTVESMNAVFGDAKVYKGVTEGIQKHGAGKKTIVFCPSVVTTRGLCKDLVSAGLRAVYVDSSCNDAEREAAIKAFHGTDADVMVNCGILTTGYDFPPIEVVVMNRATQSLPLWLQCCGRGSRVVPGKASFKILDYGTNISRLGMWDSHFPWGLMWNRLIKKKEKKEISVTEAIKLCPACGVVVSARTNKCPACGHVFKVHQAEGYLAYVGKERPLEGRRLFDLSPAELLRLIKLKGYKAKYGDMVFLAQGEERFLEWADHKKYSDFYINTQLSRPRPTVANFIIRLNK